MRSAQPAQPADGLVPPRRRVRRVRRALLGAIVLLLLLGGAGAGWLACALRGRVEPIPTRLPPAAAPEATAGLRLPGGDGLPDLVLGELRGSTVYLVVESRASMKAREGRALTRALDRWVYPPGVRGFSVGDAEGLGVLAFQIDKMVRWMRRESRLPLYIDYQGAVLGAFRLPRGHTGVVVLGPDGAVRFRHSGPLAPPALEELRAHLGAGEPPPPPPAPRFAMGPLSAESCRGRTCAAVFLARPVALAEVPGVAGGAPARGERAARLLEDPSLRLAAALSDQPLSTGAAGVFVGRMAGVPLAAGWTLLPDDPAARAAFGLAPDQAALVVVDPEGRLAFRETDLIPFWKLGRLHELLGLPED